uniref:Uncharacterized protein n=1 Tax=Mycobacterium riyadhense TaxID=486698 RepID=A0A653F4K2_9MYCO|nr:hypothetical protein BIN_B_05322 [Mycobacterium riyadhense]
MASSSDREDQLPDDQCERCKAGGCRLRRGNCDWDSTDTCRADLTQLRAEDTDAWAMLNQLVRRSRQPAGLTGHHKSPLRVPSQHVMGELKSRSRNTRLMYRLYYGEPDQLSRLVVGLMVALKRTFALVGATTVAQNRDIRTARDIFMRWLNHKGMTSGN